MKKILLAVETATEVCSVALHKNNRVFVLEEKTPQSHGQVILSLIKEVLKKNDVRLADIAAIAFGKGPGAFTGLRIGVGVVQGLAFGLNCVAVPISTLQALAQTAFLKTGARFILTALDARMDEIYWGAFSVDQGIAKPLLAETVLKKDQILIPPVSEAWFAVGSGFDRYPALLKQPGVNIQPIPGVYPSAEAVARLGIVAYEQGETVTAGKALPVYLRSLQ